MYSFSSSLVHLIYQNRWYDDQDIMLWNSGTTVRKQWSGRLVGIAQYYKNTANNPVVIKLETGSSKDWFIGK